LSQAAVSAVSTETFPKLLLGHARARANKVSIREKDLGIWQSWTWKQAADEVRWLACGLAARGFERGANLAIIGDNRPRLYWSFAAAQSVGLVPVPLYQDSVTEEMFYVLDNAEIEVAIVEDQEQVDKLLELLPRCPRLKLIVYDDPRGMRHYSQPELLPYSELRDIGREYDEADAQLYPSAVDEAKPDDVSVILYTSGTTSKPKGVCMTHRALISAARGDVQLDSFTDEDEILSYLPMAWVGDHLFSYAQALVAGFTVNCPES
jgi:long-chain acyl-CoA synthetase